MTRATSRRERQAAETRNDILDAALRLFVRQGYGATSVADVATEAGVAVPTVYASVGAKPMLVKHLVDRVDQIAEIGPLVDRVRTTDDPAEVVVAAVSITRRLNERAGDIIAAVASAATVDADIAQVYVEGMARHRKGSRAAANRLRGLGALPPRCSVDRATAVIYAMTHHTMFAHLTGDFGWTFQQCHDWLVQQLTQQLVRTPQPAARR